MALSPLIAASILAADFARLGEEARAVDAVGADALAAGSSIFHAPDYGLAIASLRRAAGATL